eukprot:5991931-Pyramimonas_sp.AAC.1
MAFGTLRSRSWLSSWGKLGVSRRALGCIDRGARRRHLEVRWCPLGPEGNAFRQGGLRWHPRAPPAVSIWAQLGPFRAAGGAGGWGSRAITEPPVKALGSLQGPLGCLETRWRGWLGADLGSRRQVSAMSVQYVEGASGTNVFRFGGVPRGPH